MTGERERAPCLSVPPGKSQPRLDLGDLGAADGHAMRRRAVELDHRAVAFLADKRDMRHRHNMAAVHPDKQAGIELRFGLRDRPWAHPLAGAVMDPGIMRVSPDAPDIGRVAEAAPVGPLDRQPRSGPRAGRLTEAAPR